MADTSEYDVTVDRSRLASRADTVALVAYAFPLFIPVAFYLGYRLRQRGNDFGETVIGRAFGALFLYLFIAWYLTG